MILAILTLALVAISIPIATWQLRQLLATKREYRRRLAAQPARRRAWQYAAVDQAAVQHMSRLPEFKGFPSPIEFADLPMFEQELYRQGLRDRALASRVGSVMLGLAGPAVTALIVEDAFRAVKSLLDSWRSGGLADSQDLTVSAIWWIFAAAAAMALTAFGLMWVQLSARRAKRLHRAYINTVR